MTANRFRAQQLMGLGRWDDAAHLLTLDLADDPQDAIAHVLLSRCHLHRDRLPQALAEAEAAIASAPDEALTHTAKAQVLLRDRRPREALVIAEHVVAMASDDADSHALLAACLLQRQDWKAALAACEAGLAIDPEHTVCADLRGHALTNLGRREEALDHHQAAVQRDPDDSEAHANLGMELLHRRQHAQALTHFAEALRLDPNNEYARVGLVESLKARHLAYRIVLAFGLWLQRLPQGARMAIIIGGYILFRIADRVADTHPEHGIWLRPITWAYMAFAYLTWIADPLFSALLLIHPLGRHALSERERRGAFVGAGLILIAVAGIASYLFADSILGLLIGVQAAAITPLWHGALTEPFARHRRIRLLATSAHLLLVTTALICMALELSVGVTLWTWAFYAWIALVFLPGFLRSR